MNSNGISKNEIALYPEISNWLTTYLKVKNPKAKITVQDIHAEELSDFLQKTNLKKYFPEYSAYKIKVDIVGAIEQNGICNLVFVEVKDTALSLINLSQLLGYCKIVLPKSAFLISTKGLAIPLHQLLNIYGRTDILNLEKNVVVRVVRWNQMKKTIDTDSVIPPFGPHYS